MQSLKRGAQLFLVGTGGLIIAACGQQGEPSSTEGATPEADLGAEFVSEPTVTPNAPPLESGHPNSIQPETTLTIVGRGEVSGDPDLAIMTAGVQSQGKTAEEAMAANRTAMNGVFRALEAAGVGERDMQTSNFTLQPQYDYSSRSEGQSPRLVGYRASNDVTVRVRDLDSLGETMDALVTAGGNTFSGLRFAMDNPVAAQNEARRLAIRNAIAKAELYAKEAGYEVARIVTVSETGGERPPQPMAMAMRSADAMESTPIATGEVSYDISVNVVFELRQ